DEDAGGKFALPCKSTRLRDKTRAVLICDSAWRATQTERSELVVLQLRHQFRRGWSHFQPTRRQIVLTWGVYRFRTICREPRGSPVPVVFCSRRYSRATLVRIIGAGHAPTASPPREAYRFLRATAPSASRRHHESGFRFTARGSLLPLLAA